MMYCVEVVLVNFGAHYDSAMKLAARKITEVEITDLHALGL